MARPKSSNARCIKGCKLILELNPKEMFTSEDVARWCEVDSRYGYQIITYGVANGYLDIVKKDYENNKTYFAIRGAGRKWLTKRWVNASVDSNKQKPSRRILPVCNRKRGKEADIRDTTRAAIQASEQCIALLSKTPSERAEQRGVWNRSSAKTRP